jgi:hypothetical protein
MASECKAVRRFEQSDLTCEDDERVARNRMIRKRMNFADF